MEDFIRQRQELIKANINNMFEKAKKGVPHAKHKYLKIENGKYIYDEKNMTSNDHLNAMKLHGDKRDSLPEYLPLYKPNEKFNHHSDLYERHKELYGKKIKEERKPKSDSKESTSIDVEKLKSKIAILNSRKPSHSNFKNIDATLSKLGFTKKDSNYNSQNGTASNVNDGGEWSDENGNKVYTSYGISFESYTPTSLSVRLQLKKPNTSNVGWMGGDME